MDEDEAEMAALRASSARYQAHLRKYGSRAAVRRLREEAEQRKATEEEEALEREWRKMNPSGSSSEEEDRLQPPPPLSSADTDGSTEEKEEDDALRSMFPMSFGAQPKQKPSTQSLHEKWKRKAPPSSRKSSITLNLSSSSSSSSSPAPGKSVAGSSSPGAQVLGKRASRSDGRNQNGNTEQPSSTVEKKSGWDEFSDDDDDDDDSDEDDANPYDLPISHEVSLEGHSRAVSAITLDPSGSRLITGSYDYNFQMYNFSGMDSSMQPFRSKEPEEGHQIRQLRYDRRGGRFLCVTGSAQPQIFDREGFDITKFVRGDMYLHDLRHTKGHISGATDGCWSPLDDDIVITSGSDGSVRFWNIEQPKNNLHVVVYKNRQGIRTSVTSMGISPNGSLLAAAGIDGGIQLFSVKQGNPSSRPSKKVVNAHTPETETSSLCWSRDNNTLISRGGDSTLKVWDVRKFKQPVNSVENVLNAFAQTDVILSPNEQLIVTPTAADRNKPELGGRLNFYNRRTLELVESLRLSDSSLVRVVWNGNINQIFVTSQDTKTYGLYDPVLSTKGCLLCAARKPRVQMPGEQFQHLDIVTPLVRREPSERKRRRLARKDPKLTKLPEPPIEGTVGQGGKIKNVKLNQFFMKQVLAKETAALPDKEEDPRAAILKFANEAKEDPLYLRAYQETQPVPIFREPTEEEMEEEDRAALASNRRYGGVEQLKQQLRERSRKG